MNAAPQVQELIRLLGPDVLLLPWPWGKKGAKWRWKHFTAAAMRDPAHIRRLGQGNIGAALGRVSNGLCSLDIDNDKELEEFLKLNPEITNTLHSRGKRGGNLWWQMVGDYPPLTPLKRFSTGWGEWRSTGSQTILYGRHPDGMDYQLVNRVPPIKIEFVQIKWPEGIFPLLQVATSVSDTESTERTEVPETTEANKGGSVELSVSRPIFTLTKGEAVRVSLPTAPQDNHKSLFTLARAIKALGLAEGRDIPINEMKEIFLNWHSQAMPFLDPSQSRDDYWFELLDANANADHPLGIDVLTNAWDLANSKEPPQAATQFDTDEIRLLVSFCRELQIMCGDKPFYLAGRTLQRLFGKDSHATCARWLRGLCKTGILKVAEQGGPDTNRATRFRYLPRL